MWNVQFLPDPLAHRHHHPIDTTATVSSSFLVSADTAIRDGLLADQPDEYAAFQQGGRGARVALADACARHFLKCQVEGDNLVVVECHNVVCRLETLDKELFQNKRRKRGNGSHGPKAYPPYVVERSDFWCSSNDDGKEETLHVMVRLVVPGTKSIQDVQQLCTAPCQNILSKIFNTNPRTDSATRFNHQLMANIACVVLQQRLRHRLSDMQSVAFLANGAILPRKSGTSEAPMTSPPAVPFVAPSDSHMARNVTVEMGALLRYLPAANDDTWQVHNGSTAVTLSGLVVPEGITLICGGGYHGTCGICVECKR
jgi:hypothetical protein